MLKRFRNLTVIGIISAVVLSGCYGTFSLTKMLYKANGKFGDKYVNSAATWVMMIFPVYFVAGCVDFLVLNTVEFWTGSNPVTLKDGDTEEQIVNHEGHAYRISVSKNRYNVEKLGESGASASLYFNPDDQSWYAESKSRVEKVARTGDGNVMNLILPSGNELRYDMEKGELISD